MPWERDEEQENEALAQAKAMDEAVTEVVQSTMTPNRPATPEVSEVGNATRTYKTLTEAQRRLEKAGLYQALINQSIFGDESARHEIVAEVSADIQQFALDRLEEMLGMKAPAKPCSDDTFTPDEQANVRELLRTAHNGHLVILSTEEHTALRLLLSKITGKPVNLPTQLKPSIQPVKTPSNLTTLRQPAPAAPSPAKAPEAASPPQTKKPGRKAPHPKRVPMPSQGVMNNKISQETNDILMVQSGDAGSGPGGVNLVEAVLSSKNK